jgi:hypothetical protein
MKNRFDILRSPSMLLAAAVATVALSGCGDSGASGQGDDSSVGSSNTGGSDSTASGGNRADNTGGSNASGGSGGGVGGSGGSDATGGSAGSSSGGQGPVDDGLGIRSCLPAFLDVCSPDINFTNEEPDGRGAMFDRVIPDPETTMKDITCTVCSILYRSPDEIPSRRRHTTVNLTIKDHWALASAGGNSIDFDVKHIERYNDEERALLEFRGVLVHETVHLYQNFDGGIGIIEGVADFVRIRVGLYEPGRRRSGGSWNAGYTTSGFFYSWLAGPSIYHSDGRIPNDPDIGWAINQQAGEGWSTSVFEERLGESVDTLWNEYQRAIQ